MRQIIDVKIKTRRVDFFECKTDALVVGRFSDAKTTDKLTRELDRRLGGAIGKIIDLGDFKGKPGQSVIVYGNEKIGARRVMLVGLGERAKASAETIRKACAHAAMQAVSMKLDSLALAVHRALGGKPDAALGRAMAEGSYFGSYRYDEFVTADENGRAGSLKIEVVDPDDAVLKRQAKPIAVGAAIGQAQSLARTIANRPANVIDPPKLAAEARKVARDAKSLKCTVFDKKQLVAKGMGGILAVGSGSQSEPRLIVLRHTPSRRVAKGMPTVALVGKAVTFDSGGISIKPATDMDHMKLDKTGGISVLATMKAVAALDVPLNVWGLIPSAENLPSGSSYRPGDIVTTYSGKTVEVLNTDAEGRVILCDALAYAAEQKCEVIIDVATLTGACLVALGTYMAGLMSNDDKLTKQLQKAAEDSGEKVWPMPSGDEYAEEMRSKIADLRNTGGKWGGACTAAAFLRQFIGDAKWAHLDIAGVDLFRKGTEYATAGSSGFGVRLLTTYLLNLVGKR